MCGRRPRAVRANPTTISRVAPCIPCSIAFANPAAAEPVSMKAVSVHDGDALTALDAANVQHNVRLTGIAATCPHYVMGSFNVVGG